MTQAPSPARLEAVVIGSGFGGAVSFCRLAQKWGDQVLLLERGKRYPMGSFPRSPGQMADNFWCDPDDGATRPKHLRRHRSKGLFDIRNYEKMAAVVSAGLGGGSLIYANVFLAPPAAVFDARWPQGLDRARLQPYYEVAKSVLGARPLPPDDTDPRRTVNRTALFRSFAQHEGKDSRMADICVFFGKDYGQDPLQAPLPMGLQEANRYGAPQSSCTYCGECDVGCNTHAKNTLDLNYLHAGEKTHGGRIVTEAIVAKITPLNAAGEEDPAQDGSHGYRVHYRGEQGAFAVDTRRVVVSAGTLGTNELLLRCRDQFKTLPKLSQRLGRNFSGNGDFVSVVVGGEKVANPNYGPVITQFTDYKLFQDHDKHAGFVLEDAAYPAFLAWFVEGANPMGWLKKILRGAAWLGRYIWRIASGNWSGSVTELFHQVLKNDLESRSNVLLCMGLDQADGQLSLQNNKLAIRWPQDSSRPLYDAILQCGKRFREFTRSCLFTAMPTWNWPFRNNITVHPLGGCALANSPDKGVVSAGPQPGQAFGYQGLYVADGSLMPTALGANPAATITALAEWIAEGITDNKPDATLGVSKAA